MKAFVIAHDYQDAAGKPLTIFARFTRHNKMCHVGRRESATKFLTRDEAAEQCPRRYYVDPRPKKKVQKKVQKKEVAHAI